MGRRVEAALCVVALGALPAAPGRAQPCTVIQVSHGAGSSLLASISADGRGVAFGHHAINDNYETFFYDVGSMSLTQLTHAATGDSRGASPDAGAVRLVLGSNANPTGDNPEGNSELFLYDTRSAALTQITSSPQGSSSPLGMDVSLDGTRMAFSSSANLTGRNPEGNRELFLYDVGARTLTQVTDTAIGDTIATSIDADGTHIAFVSTADLAGGNADGDREIYLYDALSRSIVQITHSTVGNNPPHISADGRRIAFDSRGNHTGGNADGSFEVFLYDEDTRAITQVTHGASSANCGGISADGSRIAIESTADLDGENPEGGREMFLFDIASGDFTQVSHAGLAVVLAGVESLNADGTKVVFSSTADLVGGGPAGNVHQVFLASCPRPGGCQEDATTLCLDDRRGDHRFRARLQYQTAQGGGLGGPGQAVALRDFGVLQGGLFWFFSAENPEMLLKVINGCAVNNRLWVFFSAGTNVGFTVTVTDTLNGHTWTRTNADLHAAAPVQDTAALPCN